ncbi:MAG: M23 family metallopeptidase [Smithella sp.]
MMKHLGKRILEISELVLAVTIIFVSSSAAWSAEKVSVRYLVQGKKVIPVNCRIGDWEITDIKLPDLVITNRQNSPVTLDQIDIIGKVSGNEAMRLQISGKPLLEAIAGMADMLNKQKSPLQTVQLSLGNILLPDGQLAGNASAGKGQSILLPLSKIAFLHHVGHMKIDGMEIRLILKADRKNEVIPFRVKLTSYKVKDKYIFPLKGDIQMAFLPLSYIHHRSSASQEFAMDLVGANQKGAASFTAISTPDPKKLSDYSIWGRDVLAIGDGIVVETGEKFPEEPMSDPALYTKPGYAINLIKQLIPKIGWTNAIAGNYVIIDHLNGEYSAYCHLQERSIQVKPGDKVKKATVIARVGNTGNSGAPHLHFQLMDSRDFFTANGLPVMFENVPSQVMIAEFPVQGNTLSFSDSIFHAVP